MESCNRVKDGNGRLAQGEGDGRAIWKEYFEDLYNIDTQEKVAVHICGFDGKGVCQIRVVVANHLMGHQL